MLLQRDALALAGISVDDLGGPAISLELYVAESHLFSTEAMRNFWDKSPFQVFKFPPNPWEF